MLRKYVLADLPYHDKFALMADGEREATTFQKLIEYTKQVLATEKINFDGTSRDPEHSLMYYLGRLSVQCDGKIDGGRLERAWSAWERHYRELQIENPVLELYDKMSWISEGHDGGSWPRGREEVLREWVETGAKAADFPLDDRYELLTHQFCRRLIYLRDALSGWLYEDEAGNMELR